MTTTRTAAPVKGKKKRGLNEMTAEIVTTSDAIEAIETKINTQIDNIRNKYYPELQPLKDAYLKLQTEIQEETELHRDELFEEGQKTIKIGRVKLMFRKNPSSLAITTEGADWKDVLKTAIKRNCKWVIDEPVLDKSGLKKAIEGNDKEAMKEAKALGLEVVQTEKFVIEIE